MSTPPADDVLRRTSTTVAALAASELLGKVATLLLFLLFARMLGVAEFGVLSLGFALGLLLAVLASLGLDDRVVQLGSARPEILDRCYGALVALRVLLCVAITAVATPVLFVTMETANALAVTLILVSCLVETLSEASRAVCGALQNQHRTAVVLVCQRFGTLTLSVGAIMLDPTAWVAALAYLVGTLGAVVAMHAAARAAGARLQLSGARTEARLILEAAPVMSLNAIVTMGLFRIDAALLGIFLGTRMVGIYSASYRLLETIIFVSWTLSRAFVPVVASRADDASHVRAWSQRAMLAILCVYVPYGVVLALRGDEVVGTLFGQEYVHAGVLLALAPAPLLFGIGHLSASVLLAIRPDPVVLTAGVAALVLNVGLNLVLIPTVGITGAAWATTAAFLVQATILLTALQRLSGPLLAVRRLAGVTLGACAAAVACLVIPPLLPALGVAGLAYLAVLVLVTRVADPTVVAEFSELRAARPLPPAPADGETGAPQLAGPQPATR